MKIMWDEPKRLANLSKHGLDFRHLDETFFDDALVRATHSRRWRAIGMNVHGVIAVIFVALGPGGDQRDQHAPREQAGKEALCRTKRRALARAIFARSAIIRNGPRKILRKQSLLQKPCRSLRPRSARAEVRTRHR